jgi:hypothetical protein
MVGGRVVGGGLDGREFHKVGADMSAVDPIATIVAVMGRFGVLGPEGVLLTAEDFLDPDAQKSGGFYNVAFFHGFSLFPLGWVCSPAVCRQPDFAYPPAALHVSKTGLKIHVEATDHRWYSS